MTNSTGNFKPKTVALDPDQLAEMGDFTDELTKILGRNYPDSRLIRELISEALEPEARERRKAALRAEMAKEGK